MEWIRQLLAVVVVLALLAASLAWLRRRGLLRPAANGSRAARTRRLEQVDRVALSPHHSIHLVRMDKRLILVGRSPSGLSRLAVSDWQDPEDSQ